jgi:osmotically-inducible protein OsmY
MMGSKAKVWKRTMKLQIDNVQALVLNALHSDLAVPTHRVKVEVRDGWVTMSGTVVRPYQRACAESDARRIPGVVGVTNQIRVTPADGE